MERDVSTSMEWLERGVNSYIEEFRLAALSLLDNASIDNKKEVFETIIGAIRDNVGEVDHFSGRVGDNSYANILNFDDVNESSIEAKYLGPITDLCEEYKRGLLVYLRAMSRIDRLEQFPSLSASILMAIAQMRYLVQTVTEG